MMGSKSRRNNFFIVIIFFNMDNAQNLDKMIG